MSAEMKFTDTCWHLEPWVQSNEQLKKPDPTAFSDIGQQYIQIVRVVGTIKGFDDAIGFDVLGKMEESELKVVLQALSF